jgi:protein-tyrosine-phosphatase
MKIHFVCSGNTFRSRLAEAHLNSKKIPNLEVSSSGTDARKNLNGPIAWYAMRIIQNKGLASFMSNYWKQTTEELIKGNDWVIFMTQYHYEFAKNFLTPGQKYEIWDIEDIIGVKEPVLEKEIENMKKSEEIYDEIKKRVDSLKLPRKICGGSQ